MQIDVPPSQFKHLTPPQARFDGQGDNRGDVGVAIRLKRLVQPVAFTTLKAAVSWVA
jgi:hypothetical protein